MFFFLRLLSFMDFWMTNTFSFDRHKKAFCVFRLLRQCIKNCKVIVHGFAAYSNMMQIKLAKCVHFGAHIERKSQFWGMYEYKSPTGS